MVLETPTPTSYKKIRGRHKVDQFTFQKGANWRKYPFTIKDTEFSSIPRIAHLLKGRKVSEPFTFYAFKNLLDDSITNRYDLGFSLSTTLKSLKITPSIPSVVKKRIQELERLAVGWDSYSARPININAIESAISLLILISSDLGPQLAEYVFIAPCSDGGVQLEWELNSKELIVKIAPDGKRLFFLLVSSSGDEREGSITSKAELDNLLQETLLP